MTEKLKLGNLREKVRFAVGSIELSEARNEYVKALKQFPESSALIDDLKVVDAIIENQKQKDYK